MHPVMNNTKWNELRGAMLDLDDGVRPFWRAEDVDTHFVSSWDGEWYYHFNEGGYSNIKWVEIRVIGHEQNVAVLSALKKIHVPGCLTENGFKIYGYVDSFAGIEYL